MTLTGHQLLLQVVVYLQLDLPVESTHSTRLLLLVKEMVPMLVSSLTILHQLPLVVFMVYQIMLIKDPEKMNALLSKM